MSNRKAMDARFYILGTGCQWKAGVFHRIWRVGLEKYDEWKKLDGSWQSMDGAMTKAPLGEKKTGLIPRTVVRVAARAVF